MDDSSQAKCLQSWAKCDSQVSHTILPVASIHVACMLFCSGCDKTRVPALPHLHGYSRSFASGHTNSLLCPINKSLHMKGRVNLGDLGVDGRIILKLILKKLDVRVLFVLAHDRDQSRAFMNTVINGRVE
jgi:hypothetical protein